MTRKTIAISPVESLEPRKLFSVDLKINFQPASSGGPGGFLIDGGEVYTARNGQTYGWNSDNSAGMRDRGVLLDQAFDTTAHLTWQGVTRTFELAVPNGSYDVRLVGGDAAFLDSTNQFDVEGVRMNFLTPTDQNRFGDGRAIARVTDGRLTISAASGAVNAKLAFIEVRSRSDNAASINLTPVRINFQPTSSDRVAGYLVDAGQTFGAKEAGQTYGWSTDNTSGAVERGISIDQRYDTHVVYRTDTPRTWSLAVPNGSYTVRLAIGDTRINGDDYRVNVEGQPLVRARPTTPGFFENSRTVNVTDGTITLSRAAGSRNNKLAFIEIVPSIQPLTVVSVVRVDNSATVGSLSDFATVRFSRTGPITQPLTVSYRLSGNASFQIRSLLSGSITIPANQVSRTMSIVVPLTDVIEPSRALSVAVDPAATFSTGQGSSSRVTINDTRTAVSTSNVNFANSSNGPSGVYTEAMTATVGTRTYLIGGFQNDFNPVNDNWSFDSLTNNWTERASSPTRLTHAGVAVDRNNIWLVGGYTGNEGGGQTFGTNEVWVYDTLGDVWTAGPALPAVRAAGNSVVVGRTLYYFGGQDITRNTDTPDMWALNLDNPTGGWVGRNPMNLSRNHAAALNVNGRIFVMGGQTGFDEGLVPHNDVQVYDPTADRWSTQSWTLPSDRTHTTNSTFISRGRVFMVGGEENHNQFRDSVWSINPITGQIDVLSTLPQPRLSPSAFVAGDRVFVVGGFNGSIVTQVLEGTFAG